MLKEDKVFISAIVLAAGLSRRMGKPNKLLLKYKDKSVLKTTLEQIVKAKLDEVIVVIGHESDLVEKEIKNFNLRTVLNSDYETGMGSSIKAGIKTANTNSNGFLICLGDQPLISTHEYDEILKNFREVYSKNPKVIQVPYFDKQRGNPVCFSSDFKGAILANQEKEGARNVILENGQYLVEVQMQKCSILLDVDYPNDLKK